MDASANPLVGAFVDETLDRVAAVLTYAQATAPALYADGEPGPRMAWGAHLVLEACINALWHEAEHRGERRWSRRDDAREVGDATS
jgi:hypothetical protein